MFELICEYGSWHVRYLNTGPIRFWDHENLYGLGMDRFSGHKQLKIDLVWPKNRTTTVQFTNVSGKRVSGIQTMPVLSHLIASLHVFDKNCIRTHWWPVNYKEGKILFHAIAQLSKSLCYSILLCKITTCLNKRAGSLEKYEYYYCINLNLLIEIKVYKKMCLIEICKVLRLKNFENPYLNNFYIINKIK